jgi:hypothetical protein
VVSLEGYNIHVVVFYYLSLLEIWPDEGMVCGGKGSYKRKNTVIPSGTKATAKQKDQLDI